LTAWITLGSIIKLHYGQDDKKTDKISRSLDFHRVFRYQVSDV
jgi:hypothetical protein